MNIPRRSSTLPIAWSPVLYVVPSTAVFSARSRVALRPPLRCTIKRVPGVRQPACSGRFRHFRAATAVTTLPPNAQRSIASMHASRLLRLSKTSGGDAAGDKSYVYAAPCLHEGCKLFCPCREFVTGVRGRDKQGNKSWCSVASSGLDWSACGSVRDTHGMNSSPSTGKTLAAASPPRSHKRIPLIVWTIL